MTKIIKNFRENMVVEKNFKLMMGFMIMALVVLDLGSKLLADDILKEQSIIVISNFFNLALAYNTGVSFSMFNDLGSASIILAIIALIAGIVLEFLALNSIKRVEILGYCLIASGAYGNGIDRLMHGHVIDFLDFYYKNWHYPTFNFADCFIFIGVAIILLEGFFTNKR